MVLMEESGEKPTLVMDKEPDGLNDIVASSNILEASHVKEVGDTHIVYSHSSHTVCFYLTTSFFNKVLF